MSRQYIWLLTLICSGCVPPIGLVTGLADVMQAGNGPTQPGESQMTCEQLKAEINRGSGPVQAAGATSGSSTAVPAGIQTAVATGASALVGVPYTGATAAVGSSYVAAFASLLPMVMGQSQTNGAGDAARNANLIAAYTQRTVADVAPRRSREGSPRALHLVGSTVLIEHAAAHATDIATLRRTPDVIAMASATVLIGGMPAARMTDSYAHWA